MTIFLGVQTFTVRRSEGGAFVDGDFSPGPVVELSATGSLQPTTGRDLELLSEGDRTRGGFKFYTDAALITADEPGRLADRVVVNGREMQVRAVLDYTAHISGAPHWKYLLNEPADDGL